MPQNIYDNPAFFTTYRRLREVSESAGVAFPSLPKSELGTILPPLRDAAVLYLGCGDGWFGRFALAHGAASVHGIDLSESQIALARRAAAAITDNAE